MFKCENKDTDIWFISLTYNVNVGAKSWLQNSSLTCEFRYFHNMINISILETNCLRSWRHCLNIDIYCFSHVFITHGLSLTCYWIRKKQNKTKLSFWNVETWKNIMGVSMTFSSSTQLFPDLKLQHDISVTSYPTFCFYFLHYHLLNILHTIISWSNRYRRKSLQTVFIHRIYLEWGKKKTNAFFFPPGILPFQLNLRVLISYNKILQVSQPSFLRSWEKYMKTFDFLPSWPASASSYYLLSQTIVIDFSF